MKIEQIGNKIIIKAEEKHKIRIIKKKGFINCLDGELNINEIIIGEV